MEVTSLLSLPGIIRLEHHAASHAIVVHWFKFRQVREMVDRTVEEGRRLTARTIIILPPVGELLPTHEAEIFEEYTPQRLSEVGIKASITVMTNDTATNLATKRWKNPGSRGQVEILDASSLDEALLLAANFC